MFRRGGDCRFFTKTVVDSNLTAAKGEVVASPSNDTQSVGHTISLSTASRIS
jgi:hypothetical protein